MPKVSVIIPIYNVEKYLRECLDSVVGQTLKDIEIICIDDGSPDNCPQIIDEYAKNDKRIVAIHKENGGYASAINKGFDIAKGEFIGIVESDDYCALDMYEKLYNGIKDTDADLINCNFYWLFGNENNKVVERNWSNYVKTEFDYYNLKICPTAVRGQSGPWRNLYRKSFIDKYNLRLLDDNNGSYQDVPWRVLILSKAEKIIHIDDYLYYYRKDADGSSGNIDSPKVMNYLIRREQAIDILKNNNMYYDKIKDAYCYISHVGCMKYFKLIGQKYKEQYYLKMRALYQKLYSEGMEFTYFSKQNKEQFLAILNKDYAQYKKWLKWREFNKNFFGVYKTKERTQIAILGIKIKIKRK